MDINMIRITRIKSADEFRARLRDLAIDIPFDEEVLSGSEQPLAETYRLKSGRTIGNRFCVHPMEGWDGTLDGNPTDLVFRRWRNFGRSGGKLIWGGEAFAVRPDGRANPNQLMIIDSTMQNIEDLRAALVAEHRDLYGSADDLFIGLQLTHSGRFCRPNEKKKLEPKIAYHHPVLDELFGIPDDLPIMTDMEIESLIEDYIKAAKRAERIGFDFVDIKHCHGYLGHELLSAHMRSGRYGGSFENRTRFLCEIIRGIQTNCPDLTIGVRFSAFDMPPFRPDEFRLGKMVGYRDENSRYAFAFGGDADRPGEVDLEEPKKLLMLLQEERIELVNFSAGSPYYNPHLTRPAFYPPSDGYLPPEDPLVGVARHITAAASLKKLFPKIACVGSGYSYLQEFIPNVAQAAVRNKMIDFVGLGRSTLSYPELPADILTGKPLKRNKICRTFSDCTTAPRIGLVSGCYPLDEFYKVRLEAEKLKEFKTQK